MPESLYFYNLATGERTQLSRTATRRAMRDVTGRLMPPVTRVDTRTPGVMGSSVVSLKYADRDINIPMLIHTSRGKSAYDEYRDLCEELNFLAGDGETFMPGYLELVREGDVSVHRRLLCHYNGGFEGSEGLPHAMKCVLTFRSTGEPFWEDVDPVVVNYQLTQQTGTFFPIPQPTGYINLTSSKIFSNNVVTVAGKVYCWPQWDIYGPGDTIVLVNRRTNRRIRINTTLNQQEVIRIQTDPQNRGVFNEGGASLMDKVDLRTGQPDFWPLLPGDQTIQLQMNGSDGNSLIVLSYRNRYLPA